MCLFFLLTSPSWGFSWFYKGKTRYFCFRFLPFGLSPAPYTFTKLFRPLVVYWRQQGIHSVVYLYDALGEAPSYQVTFDHRTKVKSEKSIWVPTLVIDWLGFTIHFFQDFLFIPGKKIKRVLSDINSMLEANCSSARELSALAGRINSFNLVVSHAVTLTTIFLHMFIVLQSSRDSKFPLPPSVKEELIFWKDNVRCLNGRPIGRQFPVHVQLFILMRVMLVPGESLLRASMVSFVTSVGPPMKRDAALPGASFRRSMFAFLKYLKQLQ